MLNACGLLQDVATNRWHPICFRMDPLPGGVVDPLRYRSWSHHTAGFETKTEAVLEQWRLANHPTLAGMLIDADAVWAWDSASGVPMMTVFMRNGKLLSF